MPGVDVVDRLQVEKAFLQGDVGDVSRPYLIQCCELLEINKAGRALGWLGRDRGAKPPINRSQTHAVQDVPHAVTTSREALIGQMIHHSSMNPRTYRQHAA